MICKPSIMNNRTKQLLQINLHFSKIRFKGFSETLMGTNPNLLPSGVTLSVSVRFWGWFREELLQLGLTFFCAKLPVLV